MRKQVRETPAGVSINAYVILNHENVHIATVQSHFSRGTTRVDVWHEPGSHTYNGHEPLTQSSAVGDFDSALAGQVIDGITLYDECGESEVTKKLEKMYYQDLKELNATATVEEKIDYWHRKIEDLGMKFSGIARTETAEGMRFVAARIYMLPGLRRLEALGYTVIKAI